ncbi:hypothetical protein G9A89_002882 [Geosiphon pyriformis]|nr:hypothetical protein G9A89_002868 [Geosiphon pyriformis]KAG9299875.1 hypothetical protein G9A89_002882 [Geosiphon pyriformis]
MPRPQNHERDKVETPVINHFLYIYEFNGRTEAASIEEAFTSHLGPYLGQMMSQCPPMVLTNLHKKSAYNGFINI